MLRPQRAKPARKSVRCGISNWSPRRHPPRQRKGGSGPGPPAPRTGGWRREARGASPQAPLCHPKSAQSWLAGVCTVGLQTGPHAPRPRNHGKRATGPGRLSPGWAVRGERVCNPERPSQGHDAPPPSALVPPPQRAKPAPRNVRCGVGDESPCPHSPAHGKRAAGPGRLP